MTQPVVDGQACVAMGVVSNEIYLARKLARENSTKLDNRYMIPKEGSLLWIDTLAVPVDAPHSGNAHRLIDFLMRPNVIARITESVGAANANTDATSLVRTELRDDPILYPDDATRARLHVPASLTAEYSRRVNREFTRFRTGQ
jgi:putrescine transport system substrate-binding protein